jgi:hypothetical protein
MAAIREGRTIREAITGIKRIDKVKIRTGKPIMSLFEYRTLKNSSPKMATLIDGIVNANVLEIKRSTVRRYWLANRPSPSVKSHVIGFELIMSATSSLPDHFRDDVRQAMFLASAEGRLKAGDVRARVREFVAAHNRTYSKYVPVVGGIMRSLDAPINDDNSSSLIERVTEGLWA